MNKQQKYGLMLEQLKTGMIKPREVVGGGYRNGRKVAFEWIYTQLINVQLPSEQKVSDVYASSTGMPFASAEKARASKVFKSLERDEFKTINDLPVLDHGIRNSVVGEGYLVWIKIGRRRPLSKVA